MKSRQVFFVTVILGAFCLSAGAAARKTKVQLDAPPAENILAGTSVPSSPALAGLTSVKPEMPLGPQDVLKSYEIAMSLLADKTSTEFSAIVQAERANQITREQAEYLLQQRYQIAMMQYQVLSSLHDVLKHDIEEAMEQAKQRSLKTTGGDTVLVVPLPGSVSADR